VSSYLQIEVLKSTITFQRGEKKSCGPRAADGGDGVAETAGKKVSGLELDAVCSFVIWEPKEVFVP